MEQNEQNYDLFISYNHHDSPIVLRVGEALQKQGVYAYLDVWQITLGDVIVKEVEQGISKSKAGVIFFSTNALKSNWVRSEYNRMLSKSMSDNKFKIIPIRLQNCDIPDFASDRLYFDLFDESETNVNKAATEIMRALGIKPRDTLGILHIPCRHCSLVVPANSVYCMYCGKWLYPKCPKCGYGGRCEHRDSGGPSNYFEEFSFVCLNPLCGYNDEIIYGAGDVVEGWQPNECPFCKNQE